MLLTGAIELPCTIAALRPLRYRMPTIRGQRVFNNGDELSPLGDSSEDQLRCRTMVPDVAFCESRVSAVCLCAQKLLVDEGIENGAARLPFDSAKTMHLVGCET
jgi:hypothetical protein